jgi:hypothetical protein
MAPFLSKKAHTFPRLLDEKLDEVALIESSGMTHNPPLVTTLLT